MGDEADWRSIDDLILVPGIDTFHRHLQNEACPRFQPAIDLESSSQETFDWRFEGRDMASPVEVDSPIVLNNKTPVVIVSGIVIIVTF